MFIRAFCPELLTLRVADEVEYLVRNRRSTDAVQSCNRVGREDLISALDYCVRHDCSVRDYEGGKIDTNHHSKG